MYPFDWHHARARQAWKWWGWYFFSRVHLRKPKPLVHQSQFLPYCCMRWRHISHDFVWPALSNTGIVWRNSVHQCKKLITAFFELRALIGHTQCSTGMLSCTFLVVQWHESLLPPMGYFLFQAPMLLPAWSNWKCLKTDSYEPCYVFSYQQLLNLLLSLLTLWKRHRMYSRVNLYLDVAYLDLLFLL